MPNNLGSAIGGQWGADFGTDSILKGFQLQGQRKQAGLAQQARLQAKVDKDKQNFQNQVMKYTDFSKLHPLLQPQATEMTTAILDEANQAMNSGDVDAYSAVFNKLSKLRGEMKNLEGKTVTLRNIDANVGKLTPRAQKMYQKAWENRDIRAAEGLSDKFGNSIIDGVPLLGMSSGVDPQKELLKAMGEYDRQIVGKVDKYYYDNGKKIKYQEQLTGIPPTREDAIKLGMPPTENMLTADVLAANIFDSSPNVQKAVIDSFADDIEAAFPDFNGNLYELPEARSFARNKYIEMAKDEARTFYKRQGYSQATNSSQNNFGASGGGFSIGKNTFNFGKVEAADSMETLAQIGDIKGWNNKMTPEEIKALVPSGMVAKEIITIDPPNAGKANMVIKGKQLEVENFKYIYSDKQKKWYVVGTTREPDKYDPKKFTQKPIVVEINDGTYGGIFGVYKDAPKEAIEKMFNERLGAAGYNQNFKLTPEVPRQNKGAANKTTAPSNGKNPPPTAEKAR